MTSTSTSDGTTTTIKSSDRVAAAITNAFAAPVSPVTISVSPVEAHAVRGGLEQRPQAQRGRSRNSHVKRSKTHLSGGHGGCAR